MEAALKSPPDSTKGNFISPDESPALCVTAFTLLTSPATAAWTIAAAPPSC